jgi:RNA polymerase sigma-70 factor (ECF subfamily)
MGSVAESRRMNETAVGDRREWVLSVLEAYEGRLTRYATRLLADDDGARDVVQHAFLKLCDRRPEELQERVGPWLFTVCRNRAVDVLRQRSAAASLDVDEAAVAESSEPDPADTAERRDLHACLAAALADLPAAQREAVDLWTEGFSHREIAEITGRKEGHIRVLVHRALKSLREHPVSQQMMSTGRPARQTSPLV